MKIEDFCLWDFEPDLFEGCEIFCPDCKDWSSHEEWSEGEIGCELCGSHSALICPKCDEYFDHVHGPLFMTRETKVVDNK